MCKWNQKLIFSSSITGSFANNTHVCWVCVGSDVPNARQYKWSLLYSMWRLQELELLTRGERDCMCVLWVVLASSVYWNSERSELEKISRNNHGMVKSCFDLRCIADINLYFSVWRCAVVVCYGFCFKVKVNALWFSI